MLFGGRGARVRRVQLSSALAAHREVRDDHAAPKMSEGSFAVESFRCWLLTGAFSGLQFAAQLRCLGLERLDFRLVRPVAPARGPLPGLISCLQ